MQDEIAGICREAGDRPLRPELHGRGQSRTSASMVYLQPLRDPASLPATSALVSQSGSVCIGLLSDCRRFGWSHVISSGNEAVVDAAAFIEYLIDDPPRA